MTAAPIVTSHGPPHGTVTLHGVRREQAEQMNPSLGAARITRIIVKVLIEYGLEHQISALPTETPWCMAGLDRWRVAPRD